MGMRNFVRALMASAFVLITQLSDAQEILQLGSHSYTRAPARAFRIPVTRASSFFLKVGGVAFEAVAVGRDDLALASLSYAADKPDGERLIVTLRTKDGETLHPKTSIYDWQLVPIAEFANSNEGAAMTLFGELEDKELEKEVLMAGGRAINYHPAFDNTLLGLRLMQSDIMLFDVNGAQLPRNSKGYVLGSGEKVPDFDKNVERFSKLQTFLKEEAERGERYASYVVGDLDQKIEFFVHGGMLAFTGNPYWFLWDYPPNVRAAMDDFALLREGELGKLALFMKHGESAVETLEQDKKVVDSWEAEGSATVPNVDLSQRVSAQVKALAGINPVIYDSLSKVMHYTALFRHYKSKAPKEYSAFVASLNAIEVAPHVVTPTIQRDDLQ